MKNPINGERLNYRRKQPLFYIFQQIALKLSTIKSEY